MKTKSPLKKWAKAAGLGGRLGRVVEEKSDNRCRVSSILCLGENYRCFDCG